MPGVLQSYLASATRKYTANLVEAYLRLPEDKRHWKPAESSRSAANQVAEVAILHGYSADLIRTRQWVVNDMGAYFAYQDEVTGWDWDRLKALLDENLEKIVAAIEAVPDADLEIPIQMPWSTQPLVEVCAYPQWNAGYHEGQITYIASLLDVLK